MPEFAKKNCRTNET